MASKTRVQFPAGAKHFFTKIPRPCGTFLRQTPRPLACKICLDQPCLGERLFVDYVNTWLKIKQEAAGYPSWAVSPEDQSTLCSPISTERRHRTRLLFDPKKSWTQSHGQTHAKQLLGQVWRKSPQTHHRSRPECSPSLRSGLQSL